MNLSSLKEKRTEIIKAEVGSLLFNLGKTHIGFWSESKSEPKVKYFNINEECFERRYGYKPFGSYKKYYKEDKGNKENVFKKDLRRVNKELEKFFYDTEIYFKKVKDLKLADIAYGDAIKNAGKDKSTEEFVSKIFFNGCENINSGIDKGPPPGRQKLDCLWIANAFGTYKEKVTEDRFDKQRLCFFKRLWDKIDSINKKPEHFLYEDWKEIREFVFLEIKNWYSHHLSDSRYPANDVTLWEQAYMTSSLFKATSAAIILEPGKYKKYLDKPRTIKWSILGIQYDKLGLAEKALKTHYIGWYREASQKADERIKEIIETEYALGNEVYRDETGIYFVVPENIGAQSIDSSSKSGSNHLLDLNDDLNEIKKKIVEVFQDIFQNEIYPAILVTKPTRGIMNLTYLLEKSKENFLKPIYPEKFAEMCVSAQAVQGKKVKYQGLCQVCSLKLGQKSDKGLILCRDCEAREGKKFKEWVEASNGETIWLGELQDSNGRIALLTIKFELAEWLNGNLLNTTLNTREEYNKNLDLLKRTLITIRDIRRIVGNKFELYKKQYEHFKKDEGKLISFIEEIDNILKKNPDVTNSLEKQFETDFKNKRYKDQPIKHILNNKFSKYLKTLDLNIFNQLSQEAYGYFLSKSRKELTIDDFLNENFLEYLINTEWQNMVEKRLGDTNKIDFKTRIITWNRLSDEDLDFLAEILLQFLLRKNPSPARLRRIWETTEEFFKELKRDLKEIMEIENWRCQRLVWRGITKDQCREYTYNGLDFRTDEDGNIYLISSIEQAIPIIKRNNMVNIVKKIKENNTEWIKDFTLKRNDTGEDSKIKLGSKNAEYESYLPYLSILDPTPISWQFILPAKYVPNVIEAVQERYRKNFKYVMGKLPLHIGAVFQDYKRPLYMGLKALRKIRRDINNWSEIEAITDINSFQKVQGECHECFRKGERIQSYYSLYPLNEGLGEYPFFIDPEKNKMQLVTVDADDYKDKNISFRIYPNTFDFEFLDANIRRNDIFYRTGKVVDCLDDKGKRYIKEKRKRPYELSEWQTFKEFRQYFCMEERKTKLNNIVNIIYSKLYDWEDNNLSMKKFMLSAFINLFNLNDQNRDKSKIKKDTFARLFGINTWEELTNMAPKDFRQSLWSFIDMYEFWHQALKIV